MGPATFFGLEWFQLCWFQTLVGVQHDMTGFAKAFNIKKIGCPISTVSIIIRVKGKYLTSNKNGMTKGKKIIYWVATIWLALGMLAGGVQQLLQIGGYVEIVSQLGYPIYVLSILGFWKILGVIAVLAPKFPLVKEWAYAGFFFAMSGAAISHITVGQPFTEALPSLVLLILTGASWYFRPANRKIVPVNP